MWKGMNDDESGITLMRTLSRQARVPTLSVDGAQPQERA